MMKFVYGRNLLCFQSIFDENMILNKTKNGQLLRWQKLNLFKNYPNDWRKICDLRKVSPCYSPCEYKFALVQWVPFILSEFSLFLLTFLHLSLDILNIGSMSVQINKQLFLLFLFLALLKRVQQNYKYYCKKKLFKFWMSEEIIKHRGRFNSEAVTAVEQTTNNEADSVTVKPQSDPEAPPLLELEKRTELSDDEGDQFNMEEIPFLQADQLQRSRTKSFHVEKVKDQDNELIIQSKGETFQPQIIIMTQKILDQFYYFIKLIFVIFYHIHSHEKQPNSLITFILYLIYKLCFKFCTYQFIIYNLEALMQQLIEPSKSVQYQHYKTLLERVRTYDHLAFYNKKFVNIYEIAAHGFKRIISRQGEQQAKCTQCGCCFVLDPIVDLETMEVKDSLKEVVNNHEENCQFHFRKRGFSNAIKLNKATVLEFGIPLFQQIFTENIKKKANIQQFYGCKLKVKDVLSKRQEKMLDSLLVKNVATKSVYLLSVFGWKINRTQKFICQYCGGMEENPLQFHIQQSHRSYCSIIKQKHWQIIFYKLTVNKLSPQVGEFLNTEALLHAKGLRMQIQQDSSKTFEKLRQYQLKIKGVKSEVESMEDQSSQQIASVKKFDKIGHFIQQLQEYVKNGIKKIKLQ